MSLVTLGLLFLLFLLALVPLARLWRAGVPLGTRVTYLAVLLAAGLVTIEGRTLARYLLPATLLVYLLPFTRLPALYVRWRSAPRTGPGSDRRHPEHDGTGAGSGRSRPSGRGSTVIEGSAVRLDGDPGSPDATG